MDALKQVLFSFVVVGSALIFQSCGPGFSVDPIFEGMSLGGETEEAIEIARRAAGQRLYENKCASCHGGFESSLKIGTSVSAIQSAIKTEPTMSSLALTDDQLNLIVLSLTPKQTGGLKFTCTEAEARGETNRGVRRLTTPEFANTLRSLLGEKIVSDTVILEQLAILPSDMVISSVEDVPQNPQSTMVFALEAIAKRVVELTASTPATRDSIFGSCSSATPVSEACVSNFIAAFGSKVLRRDMTVDEKSSMTRMYNDAGKNITGLQTVLYALLQSPSLLMHIEVGDAISGARVRLTDMEVANRISYLTLASPPDAALTAAAKAGELRSLTGVRNQVARLLGPTSVEAKSRIASFMLFYSGLTSLEEPRWAVGVDQKIVTKTLEAQMLKELSEYAEHIFWTKSGNFEELMTSRDSFPRSESMRLILGAPSLVANNKPVQASPAHIGYLHRPAFLASPAERTSPILRGVHIRREILCQEIPLPPDDAEAASAELGDIENQTNRARIGQLTEGPACIGCHAQINPLGYLFESYDQLARPRSQEILFTDRGVVTKTWPLNLKVQNPKLEFDGSGPTMLNDSIELTYALAKGRTAKACFSQKAFEFFRVRKVDSRKDGCLMNQTEKTAQNGSLRDVVIESIANEDIFWRAKD